MPQYVIDTLKPKNNNNFPVAEAVDVLYEEGSTVKDKIIAINALIVAAQQLIEGVQTDISELQSTKVDKVSGKGLSTNDFTNAYRDKIDDTYTKSETDTALAGKVDKVSGKGLSTNDFTNTYKNKVDNTYTKTETDSAIASKIAEVVAEAPESLDTLKEIADWIDTHVDSASAMNSAIQANATNIAKKVDKVTGKGLSTNDFTDVYKNKVDNTYIKAEVDSKLKDKVDKENGKGLSTNDFTDEYQTRVHDAYANTIENASEIEKLKSSKADKTALSETNQTVENNRANLQGQIDVLVLEAGGDSNPEVVQARIGVNGTNFPTLKARLDTMEAEPNDNLFNRSVTTRVVFGELIDNQAGESKVSFYDENSDLEQTTHMPTFTESTKYITFEYTGKFDININLGDLSDFNEYGYVFFFTDGEQHFAFVRNNETFDVDSQTDFPIIGGKTHVYKSNRKTFEIKSYSDDVTVFVTLLTDQYNAGNSYIKNIEKVVPSWLDTDGVKEYPCTVAFDRNVTSKVALGELIDDQVGENKCAWYSADEAETHTPTFHSSDKYITFEFNGKFNITVYLGDLSDFGENTYVFYVRNDEKHTKYERNNETFSTDTTWYLAVLGSAVYMEKINRKTFSILSTSEDVTVYVTVLTSEYETGNSYIKNNQKVIPDWFDVDSIASFIKNNGVYENIEFEVGSLNYNTGAEEESANADVMRCGYFYVPKGTKITSTYKMMVFEYSTEKAYITNSHKKSNQWVKEYTREYDGYVRIIAITSPRKAIRSYDLRRMQRTLSLSRNSVGANALREIGLDKLERLKNLENNTNALSHNTLGKLVKSGNAIHDSNGNPVILTGIGTHNINGYYELYTPECMETLLNYGVNCIRISLYLSDRAATGLLHCDGIALKGWINHSDELRPMVEELVEVATESGLYVILDWHSYVALEEDVTQYTEEQIEFFTYFSEKYANYSNILYEVHNEPYHNSAADLLDSVVACCNVIRANDPNAIIICGNGSDGVRAMNQLFNVTNNLDVFVSPHLYTGDESVDKIKSFVGLPVFVSEWGNSALSGDENLSDDEAKEMFNYCHTNGISYCLWKMTYQDMSTAILENNRDKALYQYGYGGWSLSDLSHNGKLYLSEISKFRFNKDATKL